MARKRDPQQLLERARQMEEEAKKIREEADRIEKEREAREDRKAGALLRRCWKTGWTGVHLQEVTEGANQVFGEPPVKQTAVPPSGDCGGASNGGGVEAEVGAGNGPEAIPGGLFTGVAKRSDGGG